MVPACESGGVSDRYDAIVIGSGPNGLVAANLLADAGWSVLVCEAAASPGGAVRSVPIGDPAWIHDVASSFYPLAMVSPALRSLGLEAHGLRWAHAPQVIAHPTVDGRAAVLSRDRATTVASVDSFSKGDGAAMDALLDEWRRLQPSIGQALVGPFPPVAATLGLVRRAKSELLDVVRTTLLPLRRLCAERFSGMGGPLLLAGSASHSALGPEQVLSGFLGWLLVGLGDEFGFPVPVGGAGRLTDALVARLESKGGQVRCSSRVDRVVVERGRAVGVEVDGSQVRAGKAVLADVAAPRLYLSLVGASQLPPKLLERLDRYEQDPSTFKVDWSLRGPIPWTAEGAKAAGTVHMGRDLDHYTRSAASIAQGRIPAEPNLVMGQMTTTDPTRSPAGTETAWAYWRLPQRVAGDDVANGPAIGGTWDERDEAAAVERIEGFVEEHAPGFRGLITERRVSSPLALEAGDANLVGGAIGGGSSELHQQLVFRPVPGLVPAATPIKGLYLASASAHPGGGVHGACGAAAARLALRRSRLRR